MKTLAGLDLNGLHDFCAREPGHLPDKSGAAHCNRLGWRSVAVRIDDRENLGDVIAGPQAERSPYGRGAGYGGHVGDPRRRLEFRCVWQRIEGGEWEPSEGEPGAAATPEDTPKPLRPPTPGEALRAGIMGAAPSAQRAALVVPDIPEMDEAAQARILEETARTQLGGCVMDLLWRPVAVVLGVLKEKEDHRVRKMLEGACEERADPIPLAVLIAGTTGIETQTLSLRRWEERLLPERRGYGRRLEWSGDWSARCRELRRQIRDAAGLESVKLLQGQTRSIERIAAGELPARLPDGENAVRDDNGTWKKIAVGQPEPFPEKPLPKKAVEAARQARYVLLYSPAGRTMTDALKRALVNESVAVDAILKLESDAAAWGALEAARCLERGEAPYLDHLPQLDLWATQAGDDVQDWSTLISTGETVEAGETYRTPEPIPFVLRAGMQSLRFRLKKGEETRETTKALKEPPPEDCEVQVSAEQRPASGYATCTVASKNYEPLRRSPLRFTWSDLGPDRFGLAPDLVEYGTDPGCWTGQGSLECVLDEFLGTRARGGAVEQVRDSLYKALSKPRPPGAAAPEGRRYAVSSSGKLPGAEDIGEENLMRIECKLGKALAALADDLGAYVSQPGREKLKVTNRRHLPATWCFVRCPVSIQDRIIEQVGKPATGTSQGGADPLRVINPWAAIACYHGLGRAVSDPNRVRRVIRLVLDPGEAGQRGERLACLSHIVSRRECASKIILENQEDLVHAVKLSIETLNRLADRDMWGDKHNRVVFCYAMLLLGGLCRVRLLDAGALPPEGPLASKAVTALERAAKKHWAQARRDTVEAAGKITEYLKGRGTDPNVLVAIDTQSG